MTGEYVIRGRSFPMVDNLTLGDAMFVEAAARMELEEFSARLDEWRARAGKDEKHEMEPGDMRVLIGLLAAAVSRVEHDWAPQKVARFVWDIDAAEDLEIVPPEVVADPLEVTEDNPSASSSNGSTISAADSPAEAHV